MLRPNKSFKPNLSRYAGQVGLILVLGDMSRIIAILLAAALAGCITSEYYVPVSGAEAQEYSSCGVPDGHGGIKLTDDASISIAMSPGTDALWINIQVALVNGATLEFLSDTVVFSVAGKPSVELTISPESGGRLPSLDPQTPLVARTPYRPYIINLRAPAGSYDQVSMRLPQIRVNGQVFPEHHTSFVHREKKGVISCVQ